MKRHNFKGLGAGHGVQRKHRKPGSIGACATPGRVFKGTRMAGRMGNVRTTTQNLTVHALDAEPRPAAHQGRRPRPEPAASSSSAPPSRAASRRVVWPSDHRLETTARR